MMKLDSSYAPPTGRTIAVLGLGYVGCVTAACLAHLGNTVIGVDRDIYKVNKIDDGHAPFYEPYLEDLVRAGREAGRLRATASLSEAVCDADIAFICVGTPSQKNGDICIDQLRRVCEELKQTFPSRAKRLIVAIRSTVFPGTCEQLFGEDAYHYAEVRVVSHPEFLREGAAVQDFFEPSLLVIGGHDPSSMQALAEIYTPLGLDACLVSLRTAELIKYACNAFHALKIAFANEIGTIAARVDVDPAEVLQTLCNDRKLNISNAYLRPGFAFGGSCLPKDLRALMHRSSRMDIALPLLESVLPSNEQHLRRWIDAALAIPQERIGVFGLAFKENTDDLRESPVVTLIEQLLAKGRDVKVFDPHIKLDAIYGSNLSFLMKSLPHIGKLVVRDLDQLLSWSEHLIIAQPPSSSAQSLILSSSIPAIDMTKLSHKPEYGTSELAGAAIHMS